MTQPTILKCGDRINVNGTEVRIEAMDTANSAILALTISMLINGERVRQRVSLPYGTAVTR